MGMSDYERDERFDPMQLAAIRRGLEEGYDVSAYARPDLNWRQMDEILRGLRDHVDVSAYAHPWFSESEMFEIRMGLRADVDVTRYTDTAFDADQMHMVCLAMTNTGMNAEQLDALANPDLDTTQMEQVVLAAAEGVDLTPWADPCYKPEQMREIRLGLKDGLDVTTYDDPETPAEQMVARRKLLKARAEQRRVRQDDGLHPLDESMADPLRRMEGKAMCAWANWQGARPAANMDMNWAGEDAARAESEYEATVRCMAMLTREPLHEVCEYVIDKAGAMIEASRPSPTPDQTIDDHGYFKLTPDGTLEPRQPKDNPFEALEWVLERHADGSYSIPDMTEEAHAAIAEASYSDFDDGDEWGSHAAVDELVARGWGAAQELERRLNEGITPANDSPKPQEATRRRPGPRR